MFRPLSIRLIMYCTRDIVAVDYFEEVVERDAVGFLMFRPLKSASLP